MYTFDDCSLCILMHIYLFIIQYNQVVFINETRGGGGKVRKKYTRNEKEDMRIVVLHVYILSIKKLRIMYNDQI